MKKYRIYVPTHYRKDSEWVPFSDNARMVGALLGIDAARSIVNLYVVTAHSLYVELKQAHEYTKSHMSAIIDGMTELTEVFTDIISEGKGVDNEWLVDGSKSFLRKGIRCVPVYLEDLKVWLTGAASPSPKDFAAYIALLMTFSDKYDSMCGAKKGSRVIGDMPVKSLATILGRSERGTHDLINRLCDQGLLCKRNRPAYMNDGQVCKKTNLYSRRGDREWLNSI